jgi:hypothetical protein
MRLNRRGALVARLICVVKARERQRRYAHTAKGKAVGKRYRQTPKGRANNHRKLARRIFVGSEYHSCARTREEAETINATIKGMISAFKQRQPTRAKSQSVPAR